MDLLRLLQGALSASEAQRKSAEAIIASAQAEQTTDGNGAGPGRLAVALADFLVQRPEAQQPLISGESGRRELLTLQRLACVLLRRVTLIRDDDTLLELLFEGRALETPDSSLQNGLAQVIAPLLVRGEMAPKKLDRFLKYFERVSSATATNSQSHSGNALVCSVKIVKVISLLAKEHDGTAVRLPETLSPIIEPALDCDARLCSPRMLARAAYAVRKFVECSLYITNSPIPDAWFAKVANAVSRPQADSLRVRCELLRALRILLRATRILPGSGNKPGFAKTCFDVCASTLGRVLQLSNTSFYYDEDGDTASAGVGTGYDSDDGEPCGFKSLEAVSLELLRELLPDLRAELDSKQAAVAGEFIRVSIVCSRTGRKLDRLFAEDSNEYVAIHEDESATNFPRHSAAGLLEALIEIWPRAALEALQEQCNTLLASYLRCMGQVNVSQLVQEQESTQQIAMAEAQLATLAKDMESALWLVGNLWFVIDAEEEPELQGALKNVAYSMLAQLAKCDIDADGQAIRCILVIRMVRARVLWALWACWSKELAADASVFRYVEKSLLQASRPGSGADHVVALYACRALARYVSEGGQVAAVAMQDHNHLFEGLIQTLRASSIETVHVALESIEAVLDAIQSSSARPENIGGRGGACTKLEVLISDYHCQALLELLMQLWDDGVQTDPYLRDSVISIVRVLLRRPGSSSAILNATAAQVPSLLTYVLDGLSAGGASGNEDGSTAAFAQSAEVVRSIRLLLEPLRDKLTNLTTSCDWPASVECFDCFRACIRLLACDRSAPLPARGILGVLDLLPQHQSQLFERSSSEGAACKEAALCNASYARTESSCDSVATASQSSATTDGDPNSGFGDQDELLHISLLVLSDLLKNCRHREDKEGVTLVGALASKHFFAPCSRQRELRFGENVPQGTGPNLCCPDILSEISLCSIWMGGVSWLRLDRGTADILIELLIQRIEQQVEGDSSKIAVVNAACVAFIAAQFPDMQLRHKDRRTTLERQLQSAFSLSDPSKTAASAVRENGIGDFNADNEQFHGYSGGGSELESADVDPWSFAQDGGACTASEGPARSGTETAHFLSEQSKQEYITSARSVVRQALGLV